MTTPRHQKFLNWMRQRKVATMKAMRHQFQLSHMSLFRLLKGYGYYTSYNHNAGYYTLADVPQFDPLGLWRYRDIGFSRYGTLSQTLVALVQQASAGMTVRELESSLQTKVANLLCRLVHEGQLQQRPFQGREVVYLAADAQQAQRQFRQRQDSLAPPVAASEGLPQACSPAQVIAILRQMVLRPPARPEQLARQLDLQATSVTAGQVRQVIEHYALEKKRPP